LSSYHPLPILLILLPPPPTPPHFPYTTLFRSHRRYNACPRSAFHRIAHSSVAGSFSSSYRLMAASAFSSSSLFTINSTEPGIARSEEHTSELQSLRHLVCRLLLEKKNNPRTVL